MSESEIVTLDTECPHRIKNKKLLQWTNLESLKYDFTRLTELSSSILDPELVQDAREILKVPPEFKKTAANVVDLRFCAYIRFVELFQRSNSKNDPKSRRNYLDYTHGRAGIIGSFIDIEGGPDVHWFFRHRVMRYIKTHTLIWPCGDSWDFREYDTLRVLENERLYVCLDQMECQAIIREIIYPGLEPDEMCSYYYSCDERYTRFMPVLQAVCNQCKSALPWGIEFVSEQMASVDKADKAMCLLLLLLVIAREEDEWVMFDESLAAILRHPRDDIRMRSNIVFALLVRHDGTKLENIEKHYDAMLNMFGDPSDEVRKLNHQAWVEIAHNTKFGSNGRMLLHRVIDLWSQKLDKMVETEVDAEDLREQLFDFAWLITPRVDYYSNEFDLISEGQRLYEYLKSIVPRRRLFKTLCEAFWGIYWDYVDKIHAFLTSPEMADYFISLADQYDLVLGKASIMLARQFDEAELDGLIMLVTGDDPQNSGRHNCIRRTRSSYPEADYNANCDLIIEIFDFLNYTAQMTTPNRFKLLFTLLHHVGFLEWTGERMQAMESCFILAITKDIKLDENYQRESRFERCSACRRALAPTRLAYFDRSQENLARLCEQPRLSELSDKFRGIQSRRMALFSMCKLSIFKPEQVFAKCLPKMIDLLDELQFAYELRASQEYLSSHAYEFLLPTCTELTFPSPFDDPSSPLYICEFVYFKDTLRYLQRREAQVYRETFSKLDGKRQVQLHFYSEFYENFGMCCATTSFDRRQIQFQCINHKIMGDSDRYICPLLKRDPSSMESLCDGKMTYD